MRGRRVAVIGDATIGLADELSQRGARLVHAYDPDPARTAEALARTTPGKAHPVSYAVFSADLGVRDGAFDVLIVPDLSIFADAADVLRRVRRLCASSGIAVFAAPNTRAAQRRLVPGATNAKIGSPPSYYELYDLVSLQFAKVRMIGQAPFVGYTVADFAPNGEPDVSVDTSLLVSSEEPEYFIAVGSDRTVKLDAYAVIGLPWAGVAEAIAPSEPSPSMRTSERLATAEAQAHAALLTAEVERLREREASRAHDAKDQVPLGTALTSRVTELEAELAGRDAKLREVEARAGDNHVRGERLTHQIRDLEEELRRQRERGTRLSKQLDDEKKARTRVELEIGMLRGKPELAAAKDRADGLTAELDAARARIADLEHHQAETKRRLALPAAPPPPLPPPAVTDPKLLHRLGELEQAATAALREATEAASQRDAAVARVRQLEASIDRRPAVEAQLLAVRHEKAELGEHVRAAEATTAVLERRLAAERDRASGVERDAKDRAQRLATAEGLVTEQQAQIATLGAQLAEAIQELGIAREKLAVAIPETGALEAASAEIARLEEALRDRGRKVTELERAMRESERVGKELLVELEEARTEGAAVPSVPPASVPDALRGRLDALAANAARSEAELQTATWRIAQLERELAEARPGASEPSSVQVELEQALAAARDEVASLRRALGRVS